jgi:hypothetical protein
VPKLGIDNENGAVCSRNRILATNSPKPASSAESSFDTLQASPRPFGRFANRGAETLPGTVDTSSKERQRDRGMALTFIPSDLIEQAAREENWTDSDRQHCSRMLRQAFEESLEVKEIQRSVNGLIAYDSPFVSFEPVRFAEGAEKPVLQALEDLSKKLLLAKVD